MASATNSTTIFAPASSVYGYTLTAYFNENSTDVNANTSNITVTATLSGQYISFDVANAGTLAIYWHDNKDNVDVLKNSITLSNCGMSYGNKDISATFDVTHNDDGNLSGYAYATWTKARNYPYVPATGSVATANTALTYIPRAGNILLSSSNITVGDTLLITNSPYVSGFTYTLTASNSNGTINFYTQQSISDLYIVTNAQTTDFYTFLASNQRNASVTITLTTYSGNTIIGTDTKTITVNANANDLPTITVNSIDTGKTIVDTTKTTLDLTGDNTGKTIINKWNEVSSQWTATTGFNTTISNVSINETTVTTSPTTLNDISNSITITATNARDYSKTLIENDLTFIPYEYPSIVPTIKRNTATDGHVNLTFTGMFYNIDFGAENNDLTLEWYVREKGTQNYTQGVTSLTYTPNADNKTYKESATISLVNPLDQIDGLFDYTKAYEFKFVATDLITSYTISEVLLTNGIPNFVVFKNAVFANGRRIDNIIDDLFPIGKVEVFFDNLDHSNYLGLTWQRVTGAYMYAGTGGQTGGSNTSGTPSTNVTGSTALTPDQMPSHQHTLASTGVYTYNPGSVAGAYSPASGGSTANPDAYQYTYTDFVGGSQGHTHSLSDHTHNVEPLRIEFNVWRRIA